MNSITTVSYRHDGTTFPGVDVVAFGRCMRHAASEWNRVLSGMVKLVPSAGVSADVRVVLGFAHKRKHEDIIRPGWRVLGSADLRPGSRPPEWDIELRDDSPAIDWRAPNPTKFGIWWRGCMGIRPDAKLVTATMLHELGHVLQLPHDICPAEGWIMSPKVPQREVIEKTESTRYRQYFHDKIWIKQNEA